MEPISSGAQMPANKGKRFLAAVLDIIVIPLVFGLIIGFLVMNAGELVRNVVLIAFNVGWLVFRDTIFSPGRALVGIKLISLTGEKVTVVQALIRNLLLIIPIVLLVGYIIEIISVLARNQRLADQWAKTQVIG